MIVEKEFIIGETKYKLEYATYKDCFWEKTEFLKYSLRIVRDDGQLMVMSWYKLGEGFHVFLFDVETHVQQSLKEVKRMILNYLLNENTISNNPRRSF